MRGEIVEGVEAVLHHPLLRSSAIAVLIHSLAGGIFGALVVLYMSRGLGFNPGILGMIWAVGGISSFLGSAFAPRFTQRLGSGLAMVVGLGMFGISQLFAPLASGATFISAMFLVVQQTGDGFYVIYEVNQVSLRQGITSEHMMGRVNATIQIISLGATLAGSLLGGLLGEVLGVRLTLVLGACGTLLAALAVAFSPLRGLKEMPKT
jgi:predicted MFS family arabinose efflux permease